jgi:hypothetical protein
LENGAIVPGNNETGRGSSLGLAGRLPGGSNLALSEQDITRLGAEFKSASSPIARRLAFARLLEGLTTENAMLIRAQLEHMPDHSPEFREFHYAWGSIAGESAVLHGKETKQRDMAATFAGWASADPTAAISWFESLPSEGSDRNGVKWGAVYGLADADPEVAVQFIRNLRSGGDKDGERMMHAVTSAVLRSGDPGQAAEWVDGLEDEDLRVFARERVAGEFVRRDPVAAAAWAAEYNNQPDGSRLINHVSRDWAHRDPKAAVTWLESLDSSDGRTEGFGSAFGAWAGRDPEAAGNYLNEMPRSPERDAALSGYANRIVHEDPSTAVSWADAISDPQRREETLIRTGQHFYRRDREAAAAWLAQSGLSDAARQRVVHQKR